MPDDPYRQAQPLGQRRLNVHIAPGYFLVDLIDAVLRAVSPGDDDAIAVLAALRCGQLGADAQQRGQRRAGDDATPMPIHVILQPGIAGRIGTHKVVGRPVLRERMEAWDEQAPLMLSSFRREYARATQEADIHELVDELERVSPEFKTWWRKHDVHTACNGVRKLMIDGKVEPFEYTSLTIDEDRHLRLVVYARQQDRTAPDR